MTAVYALWAETACCMQGDAIYAWKCLTKIGETVLKVSKITKF